MNLETSILKLYAHGPLYEEEDNFEEHKIYRDKLAAIEFKVALLLKEKGCNVVGLHGCKKPHNEEGLIVAEEVVRKALTL